MKNKLLAMMFGAVLVLGACGGNKAENEDTGTTGLVLKQHQLMRKKSYKRAVLLVTVVTLKVQGGAPALADVGDHVCLKLKSMTLLSTVKVVCQAEL